MQEQPLDRIPTHAISSPDKFLQPETPAGFVEPSSRTSGFGQTAEAEVSSEKTSLVNSNEDVPLVPADDEATALTGHDDEVSKADYDGSYEESPLPNEPVQYVREFFARNSLKMMFDDTVLQEGKHTTAHTREMVEPVLATQPLNVADVLDMIVIDCKENELKAGEIRSAFRHVVRDLKHQRRNEVLRPLLEEPTIDEMNRVSDERGRLDLLFEDMPSDLPPWCVLSEYAYQVKSKVLGRDVENHLMPVITSSVQGSGKTTFAKNFLRPLCELATGASLLSDFGDRRTIGLFRFPAVFLDDLEAIAEKDVPVLKSIITGENIHRRLIGSSMDVKVRQMSTPMATSNSRIEHLVPDDSGYRRFVTLPFRNGSVAKGGDPKVWEIVMGLDYELLWRAVDPFGPSPISNHLAALAAYQAQSHRPSGLLKFLIELDLQDRDVKRLAEKFKQGIPAQDLHDLYEARTGDTLTKHEFSKQMFRSMQNPLVPFGDKHRLEKVRLYRFRKTARNGAEAES